MQTNQTGTTASAFVMPMAEPLKQEYPEAYITHYFTGRRYGVRHNGVETRYDDLEEARTVRDRLNGKKAS